MAAATKAATDGAKKALDFSIDGAVGVTIGAGQHERFAAVLLPAFDGAQCGHVRTDLAGAARHAIELLPAHALSRQ